MMATMPPRPVLVAVALAAISGCKGPASKDAPPAKTEPATIRTGPAGSIDRAKQGVQKANEAAVQRTDDAYDRATKQESSERRPP
jgi:hypothetical protein